MSCPMLVRDTIPDWYIILCTQKLISVFKKCDLSEFYRDAKEVEPMNAPKPKGKEVDICMFVDSYHVGDKASCISMTVF